MNFIGVEWRNKGAESQAVLKRLEMEKENDKMCGKLSRASFREIALKGWKILKDDS